MATLAIQKLCSRNSNLCPNYNNYFFVVWWVVTQLWLAPQRFSICQKQRVILPVLPLSMQTKQHNPKLNLFFLRKNIWPKIWIISNIKIMFLFKRDQMVRICQYLSRLKDHSGGLKFPNLSPFFRFFTIFFVSYTSSHQHPISDG